MPQTISDQIETLCADLYHCLLNDDPKGSIHATLDELLDHYDVEGVRQLHRLPDAVAAEAVGAIRALIPQNGGAAAAPLAPARPSSTFSQRLWADAEPDETGDPDLDFMNDICEPKTGRVAPAAGDDFYADFSLPPLDLKDVPGLLGSSVCADRGWTVNWTETINNVAEFVHRMNISVGWWSNIVTGEPKARNVGEMLALVHSEISEALDHHRMGTMDDKLPDRPGIEVELADAVIRILDIAAAGRLDLGGAILAKMKFNAERGDHKIENRQAAGGKAF